MILFRADGNEKTGSGHIMRCLSLADAAGDRGIGCCFVTAGAEFREIIEERGHKCVVLGTDYSDMESELPSLIKILNDARSDAIIVDSYCVTQAYLEALRHHERLIYIDDLAAFAYPVDVLINYNIYAPDMGYERLYAQKERPVLLLGAQYAPLRREFQNMGFRRPSEKAGNVFVSTGGADSEHIALRLIQYLKSHRNPRYTFHFLLGAMNRDREEIENLVRNMSNIVIHKNVTNMRELMCSCDAAISAAGSTLYELCACSVPIITYILADNQIAGARKFADRGLALLAGDARSEANFCDTLLCELDTLARDYTLRMAMAERAYSVVDGKGADRVISAITERNVPFAMERNEFDVPPQGSGRQCLHERCDAYLAQSSGPRIPEISEGI